MRKVAILGANIFEDERERDILGSEGFDVGYFTCEDPLDLLDRLMDREAIIVNLDRVSRELIDRLPNLKAIGRYGVGVDNIDIVAATEKGIAVINVPDYCVDEVAEHALSFIFAANRKLAPSAALTRRGVWGKVAELKPVQSIKDITVGIVGTGRIGMRLIGMIAPFGCRILVHDPYLSPDATLPPNATRVDLERLYGESDCISIHCPLTEQTRHMFDIGAFRKMTKKPSIINVSRGAIIKEADLLKALDEDLVSYASLDVLETEPPVAGHPLLTHPKAIVTNHIAWYSIQAEQRLRDLVSQRVADYLNGKPVPSVINLKPLKENA